MKKTISINSDISSVIAGLGHTDEITIADAGLPIPLSIKKIDLAIKLGLPSFLDVLGVINTEMEIEEIIMSEDVSNHYPNLVNRIKEIISKEGLKISLINHEQFKKRTHNSKAIIRTGENKVFHNIILKSGVKF